MGKAARQRNTAERGVSGCEPGGITEEEEEERQEAERERERRN